jgi:hypothetical protein
VDGFTSGSFQTFPNRITRHAQKRFGISRGARRGDGAVAACLVHLPAQHLHVTQERSREGWPVSRYILPGELTLPAVKICKNLAHQLIMMLNVIPVARQLTSNLMGSFSRAVWVIGSQLRGSHNVRAQVHLRIKISALAGMLHEEGATSGDFRNFTKIEERPKGESLGSQAINPETRRRKTEWKTMSWLSRSTVYSG